MILQKLKASTITWEKGPCFAEIFIGCPARNFVFFYLEFDVVGFGFLVPSSQ
jgi:hypothetical protein